MSTMTAEHNLEDNYGLFLVSSPRPPLRAVCDIVAVHGLSGGAASTWKHTDNQNLWLRDFLPATLESLERGTSVRIWTFGYNANTVFSTAVAGIAEFSRSLLSYLDVNRIGKDGRKVIFVAHSLGGVVVKSALIDASRRNSPYSWLFDATIGIIFLATPHQGSKIADKGLYVARIAKYTCLIKPNTENLKSLKRNSGELFDKAEHFRDICGRIQICSFYETLPMGSFGMIVEKSSAMIGLPDEQWLPLNADHRSICKFAGPADQNLILVQHSIKTIVDGLTIPSIGFDWPRPPPLGMSRHPPVDFPRDQSFIGSQWGGQSQISPPRSNYQPPSVSTDDESVYSTDPRPSTSVSTASSDTQYSNNYQAGQAPQRPPRPSFASERGRSPANSRSRAESTATDSPGSQTSFAHGFGRSQSRTPSAAPEAAESSFDPSKSWRVSPSLQSPQSSYSLTTAQLAETNRQTSPAPPVPKAQKEEPIAFMCDVCNNDFPGTVPRFHCMVCHDYDLCLECYQKEKTSKGHDTSHEITSIKMMHSVEVNDIVPAAVIPQHSPPRALPNWTVEGDHRWLHLRDSPSHERFIVHGVGQGAYWIKFALHFKFSKHVSLSTFNQLKKDGSLGSLKIATGAPSNTSTFFKQSHADGVDLGHVLFESGYIEDWKMAIPENVIDPGQTWEQMYDFAPNPVHIGAVTQGKKPSTTLAVLLQWSGVRKFESSENPLLLISINEIKMNELLEYKEPPPPPPPEAPKAASASPSNVDDNDYDISVDELLEATNWLMQNNRAVTSANLLAYIATTRQLQTELQKALLLRHIQQVQEQQRREREQRQRLAAQSAAELLLLGLFLGDN